jgi:hypothetical protein
VRVQPGKQVVVLRGRDGACQGLVQMVVRIDQARQHDLSGRVDHRVGRVGQLIARADRSDDAVFRIQAGTGDLPACSIHRHQHLRVLDE